MLTVYESEMLNRATKRSKELCLHTGHLSQSQPRLSEMSQSQILSLVIITR